MAWRDSRQSRRRLLLYSTSIVLGVAALIAIGSLGENLRQAIEAQAKTLLGADLAVLSNAAFGPEENRLLNSLGGTQAREVSFSSMVFFPKPASARLAQVRALQGDFPFYGSLDTDPKSAAAEFRSGSGVLVEDSLMKQFALVPGDQVKIGESLFAISGSLLKVPGEMAAFAAIAPRVYMALRALPRTELLRKGSLVRHKAYFKFAPSVDVPSVVNRLRPALSKLHLEVDTVEHRKRDLGRAMSNLYHFLNLVGFIALLLGGIGVASAIHVHVRQKLASVAILRSLGCTSVQAFAVYLAQGIGLGLVGVGAGIGLGIAIQMGLPAVLADFVPLEFSASVAWGAVAQGASVGFVICVLFALLPLLPVRRITPLAVLRAPLDSGQSSVRDPWLWACSGLIALGLITFSISQCQRWKHGLAFGLGVILAFVLLAGISKALIFVVKRQAHRIPVFAWRQGLASLSRPNNRTALVMLSLGLGTFLILTLYLLQQNLTRELLPGAQGMRPDAVLFDVQSDQVQGVVQLLKSQGLPVLQQTPVVTMRLAEVKGRTVEQIRKESGRGAPTWALRREYRSTYRGQLVDSERMVSGTWHQQVAPGTSPVPVSLEEGIARTLHVGLGDELVFDVQGLPVRTVVASLREVDWRRLQPNFFVVFPLGVLEDAPSFYVLVTRVGSSARSAQMQRALVQQFPNVSTIDLTLVVQTLDSLLNKIAFVVRFMALFTVGTGLIVLIASILSGRYQRLRESILLRTLGASRGQIRQMLVVEYLSLGSLASLTGILLSVTASWGLAMFVFNIQYHITLMPLLTALLAVSSLTVATGLLASRGVCDHPPLEALRAEA
jgi:putative ABC transport system permease protein